MKPINVLICALFISQHLYAMQEWSDDQNSDLGYLSSSDTSQQKQPQEEIENDWSPEIPNGQYDDKSQNMTNEQATQKLLNEMFPKLEERNDNTQTLSQKLEEVNTEESKENEKKPESVEQALDEMWKKLEPSWNPMHYWAWYFTELWCTEQNPLNAIESLKEEFKKNSKPLHEALLQTDEQGNLPIHYAVSKTLHLEADAAYGKSSIGKACLASRNTLYFYYLFIKEITSTPELHRTLDQKASNGKTPREMAEQFYNQWKTEPHIETVENPDGSLGELKVRRTLGMPWLYNYITQVWPQERPTEEHKQITTPINAIKQIISTDSNSKNEVMNG